MHMLHKSFLLKILILLKKGVNILGDKSKTKTKIPEEGVGEIKIRRMKLVFVFISSFFMLSVIRFSLVIPSLMKESSFYIFDPTARIPYLLFNNEEMANMEMVLPYKSEAIFLMFSEYGFMNLSSLPILVFFFCGVVFFVVANLSKISEDSSLSVKDCKILLNWWIKISGIAITLSAFLVTISSNWKG